MRTKFDSLLNKEVELCKFVGKADIFLLFMPMLGSHSGF